MIRSISEYDHDDPLTEKYRNNHQRGRSESTTIAPKSNILFKLGNLDEALKKAQNLLDNKPKDENYLYLKGRVLEKLERINEAERCFKDALDINPKFSQAAFYLAAIENKRGNFEKSIDLYNYALSKDKIPVSGNKSSTPFVSIDIGVACDNTIKANFAGGMHQLVSNLKSLNSLNIQDLKQNNNIDKRWNVDENTTAKTRQLHERNPSGSSTNMGTTVKDAEILIREPEVKFRNADSHSKQGKPSAYQKGSESAGLMDESPIINKKQLRKAWRIGKSGNLRNKIPESEIPKNYPQDFYSLGNSINNTESISLSSNKPGTSKVPSTYDVQSSLSKKKVKKKAKVKSNKVDFLNFSDRTLSSKFYSIKRKEIHLYTKTKSVMGNWRASAGSDKKIGSTSATK